MKTPPSLRPATIRTLARQLNLSATTVSESLRGVARVAPETAARVRTAAARAGYRCNPLVGAVLAHVRRSDARGFRGVIGLLDTGEGYRPTGAVTYHAQLVAGVEQRCRELGFALDRFTMGAGGLTAAQVNRVLAARSVRGLLVLPAHSDVRLDAIHWDGLAGLYLDRVIEHPPLHCVGPSHFDAIWTALAELTARGYRRPGLVMEQRQDERLRYRRQGAFLAFCGHEPRLRPVPVLVAPTVTEEKFAGWFRQHHPDVVLAHGTRYLGWIRRAGGHVPRTCGFVSLNAAWCELPCARMDLQPGQIARLGTDLLVGQILRGERGVPVAPSYTSPAARWVDGPTVRGNNGA